MATMSSWTTKGEAFMQNIKKCTVQVRVFPAPLTFAERRAVLQVLEQQGPIKVFKKQKPPAEQVYANPTFLVVTSEPKLADSLLSRGAIQYTMARPQPSEHNKRLLLGRADLKPLTSIIPESVEGQADVRDTTAAADGVKDDDKKQFRIEIHPHQNYSHSRAISGSPWNNEWPSGYDKDPSLETIVLKQALPKTVARDGLAHWLSNGGNLRPVGKEQRAVLRRQSSPIQTKRTW